MMSNLNRCLEFRLRYLDQTNERDLGFQSRRGKLREGHQENYDSQISPGHISRKKNVQKCTCTPVFIAAVFTIAKMWKQPKCPLTEEWIKTMWYLYTEEYYSAIKKNEIMPFTAMWMDLESIILSAVSKTERRNII